jgi:hypothetical protein
VPLLIEELRKLLIAGGLVQGVNLHVAWQDDQVLLHVMAVSIGSLGGLLAILSDQAELDDPASLSRRITPGEGRSRPDRWQYELIASRYPIDQTIVFSAKIHLPVSDLPEVVHRLRQRR